MVQHLLSPIDSDLQTVLQTELCLSIAEVEFLIDFGAVYHNHKRCRFNTSVKMGDYIRAHTDPRRFPTSQREWSRTVISENEDFIVINKPKGIPTHATVDNFKENALWEISKILNQAVFVTNRLDIATSGLLIFAKNSSFQKRFNGLIRDGKVLKKYRALVEGHVKEEGLQTHYMEFSHYQPKKVSADALEGWQKCLLEIQQKKYLVNPDRTELEIQLITGRTHQIRAQMSFLGHPVVGDFLYQSTLQSEQYKEFIQLESCRLSFEDKLIPYDFYLA